MELKDGAKVSDDAMRDRVLKILIADVIEKVSRDAAVGGLAELLDLEDQKDMM